MHCSSVIPTTQWVGYYVTAEDVYIVTLPGMTLEYPPLEILNKNRLRLID